VDMGKEATDEEFRALLTEKELEGLVAMREKDPELTKPGSDIFLARFLFARKLDVTRALAMLKNHVAWRVKFKIESEFSTETFKPIFQSGMNIWAPNAKDRQGRAVGYLRARNMDPTVLEDLQRYIHFSYYCTDLLLDTDISFMREGMIVVEDFGGATLSTFGSFMGGKVDTKEMFESIQENIPARIRAIILLDAPWYVRLLIALVKPFMKKRMREKIISISTSELTTYISPENLLEEYGGTLKFDYMAWSEEVVHKRPCLSEGKYFNIAGVSVYPTAEETKKAKKDKKKKKSSKSTDKSNGKSKGQNKKVGESQS